MQSVARYHINIRLSALLPNHQEHRMWRSLNSSAQILFPNKCPSALVRSALFAWGSFDLQSIGSRALSQVCPVRTFLTFARVRSSCIPTCIDSPPNARLTMAPICCVNCCGARKHCRAICKDALSVDALTCSLEYPANCRHCLRPRFNSKWTFRLAYLNKISKHEAHEMRWRN